MKHDATSGSYCHKGMKPRKGSVVRRKRMTHAKNRLLQRYGIRASPKQLQSAVRYIEANRECRFIALTGSKSICKIPRLLFDGDAMQDEFVYVVYSKTRATLVTALPEQVKEGIWIKEMVNA